MPDLKRVVHKLNVMVDGPSIEQASARCLQHFIHVHIDVLDTGWPQEITQLAILLSYNLHESRCVRIESSVGPAAGSHLHRPGLCGSGTSLWSGDEEKHTLIWCHATDNQSYFIHASLAAKDV